MQTFDAPHIRVLVAHANPIIAIGLAAALRRSEVLDVHVESPNGPSGEAGHQVLVTDGDSWLYRSSPANANPARTLMVCDQLREHEVRRALERGVLGCVPLSSAIDELVTGVLTVARGSRYLTPAIAQCMAESLMHEALTARESQVLSLLASGQCNKTIANRLDIAVGTVKAHVKAIMAKLDASSRTQAVSVAAQRGLVNLEDRPASVAA